LAVAEVGHDISLANAVAMRHVTTWRLLCFTCLARHEPDASASVIEVRPGSIATDRWSLGRCRSSERSTSKPARAPGLRPGAAGAQFPSGSVSDGRSGHI